jgi:hypothetical protein
MNRWSRLKLHLNFIKIVCCLGVSTVLLNVLNILMNQTDWFVLYSCSLMFLCWWIFFACLAGRLKTVGWGLCSVEDLGIYDVESSGSAARVSEVRKDSNVPVSTTAWHLEGRNNILGDLEEESDRIPSGAAVRMYSLSQWAVLHCSTLTS